MSHKGFFSASTFKQERPDSLLPQCGRCKLNKNCDNPKRKPQGKGKRKILIVLPAPTRDDDEDDDLYRNEAALLVASRLKRIGIDLRNDCWLASGIGCPTRKDEMPNGEQIRYCSPLLRSAINTLAPRVIVPIGLAATRAVLHRHWKKWGGGSDKKRIDPMRDWAGRVIPLQDPNCWVVPTYHPREWTSIRQEDLAKMVSSHQQHHLKELKRLKRLPWKESPDFLSRVHCHLDAAQPIAILKTRLELGEPVAIDYETDRLKPEPADARIVSASLAFRNASGELESHAFLMNRKIAKHWFALLHSGVPIVAANMQFEQRWTRHESGQPIKNLIHDVCLWGRLECNQSRCSLKYQSLVTLGLGVFNDKTEKYLEDADSSQTPNKIDEIDVQDLLQYNGLDTLTTYLLYETQTQGASANDLWYSCSK